MTKNFGKVTVSLLTVSIKIFPNKYEYLQSLLKGFRWPVVSRIKPETGKKIECKKKNTL